MCRALFINPWDRLIGPNRYLVEILRHAPELARGATVVFHEENDARGEYEALGCRVEVWPETRPVRAFVSHANILRLGHDHTVGLARMVRRLKAVRPDVVVSNTENLWIGGMACRVVRIPHAQVVHSLAFEYRWHRFTRLVRLYLRWLSYLAGTLVAVSETVARMLRGYIREDGKIAIAPNGLDVEDIEQRARSPLLDEVEQIISGRYPVIVSVGRIAPMKGQDILVDAVRKVRDRYPRTICLIVGRTGDARGFEDTSAFEKNLYGQIRRYGLEDCVRFLGEIDYVPALLARADVYAHPSRTESFCRVVAEALICEKPVVCSNAGAIPEVVGPGGALLVPPGDPSALAEGLLLVSGNESLRARQVSSGRAFVKENYRICRTSRQFVEALLSVAGSGRLLVADRSALKRQVRNYWEKEPCDTRYGRSADILRYHDEIERKRYQLEPFIMDFAGFAESGNKRVLEVGVGVGTDFWQWIKSGARAVGMDIPLASIEITRRHLHARGVRADRYGLLVADAEKLPFREDSFNVVYSWGVLHHTPGTEAAFAEAFRVLAPGGTFKGMVYHSPSWTCWLLWLRYGLLVGRPSVTVQDVVAKHLESPGTKVYGAHEICRVLADIGYRDIRTETVLGPSDLLLMDLSEKYCSAVYRVAQKIYPRWLVRRLGNKYGLLLLVKADRPV